MTRPRLVALVLAAVLALPAAANAAGPDPKDALTLPLAAPVSQAVPPLGFGTSARQAIAIANATPTAAKLLRREPGAQPRAFIREGTRWEVDYFRGDEPVLEVDMTASGRVTAVWSGIQARSYLAQGHFGGLFDSPWVILPFTLLFLAPFVDPRRPFRLLHLDLLVMASFGVSYWLFSRGHATSGVTLVYPVLLYLLARLIWTGARPSRPPGRLVPLAPTTLLAIGLVALVGARVGLNLASDKVVDVGYASVVGADRIQHGKPLYIDDASHGDTYGPIAYVAYIPFELAFPWHGSWDYLPSAHAAALAFDLLTILGLFLLGRQMRAGPEGNRLGLALAWAWAAFPFTLLGVVLNVNDGLVALLSVFALLAYRRSPGARGVILGLAAAAKFLPAALLPLFAAGRDTGNRRRAMGILAAGGATFALVMALFLPDGGLREVWNCTLGYQLSRRPDTSFWGLHEGLGALRTAIEVAALALAALVALVPRRRSFVQLCALAGAVAIAVQLAAGHWFWFYIVWFVPFALVALLAPYVERREGLPLLLSKECGLTWPAADAPPRRRGARRASAGSSMVSSFRAFRSSSSTSST